MTKSKVVKFDVKEPFEGKNSAFIAFDDKAWGFYEYSGEPTIKVGDELEYSIETKTTTKKDGTTGKPAKVVTIITEPPPPPIAGGKLPTQPSSGLYTSAPKSYDEMKCDLRAAVIKTLGTVAAAGKIEPKEMVEYFNEFYPAVDLSIDVLSK